MKGLQVTTRKATKAILAQSVTSFSIDETGRVTTNILDDPSFFFFLSEASAYKFDMMQFRKMVKETLMSKSFDLDEELRRKLMNEISSYGRRHWPFQKKVKTILKNEADALLQYEEECETTSLMILATRMLEPLLVHNGEVAGTMAASKRSCAIEFERRCKLVFPNDPNFAFFCLPVGYLEKGLNAIYSNPLANVLAERNLEEDMTLIMMPGQAHNVLERTKAARPHTLIFLGSIAIVPPKTGAVCTPDVMYMRTYLFPADGVLYNIALFSESNKEPEIHEERIFEAHARPYM